MVLVDSSHEDRLEIINGQRIRPRSITTEQLRALFKAEREAEKALESKEKAKTTPEPATRTQILIDPTKPPPPYDKLPAENQKWRMWARSKPRFPDISEYREPLVLTHSTRAKKRHPLGAMPLVVISSGQNYFENEKGTSRRFLFADHQRLEADLATLSTHGKLVLAPRSGHHIQLDQPDLVIKAVDEMVQRLRKKSVVR